MDSNEWKAVKKIFSQAIELPSDERENFVAQSCKENPEQEKQILSMIASETDNGQSQVFDQAVSGQLSNMLSDKFGIKVGSNIGAFKIESQIGQGGMGKVFLASRTDESFDQKVAIKVIDSQSVNQQTIQRFELERQILAKFEHPNIARLIDGGTTGNGLPYIVMEYIEGETITAFCKNNNKSIKERLKLFIQVSNAVTYAHQNLVIHRDIKPSNILVTNSGEVKLLDFGIAKLQVEDEQESLDVTQEHQRVFTPSNASPEQLIGQPITTRTDIYELGALLYHLLTDQPLFKSDSEIRAKLEQAIIEQTPVRPSALVKKAKANSDGYSGKTIGNIKSELDVITLKALKKDPTRRYQSAIELVNDIERFINNFPILARRDSFFYRTKKFISRNTALSISVMISSMFMLAFMVTISYQNIEIENQKQVALDEAIVANKVVDFMINIFNNANPDKHLGEVLSAEDLLQTASESLEEFTYSQAIKDRLTVTIARSFQKMGKYELALPLIEEVASRNNANSEKEKRSKAKNLYYLGALYSELVQDEKSIVALENSISIYEKLFEEYHSPKDELEMTFPLTSLGAAYSFLGKYEEAKILDLKALEISKRQLGDDHYEVGSIYNNLGHVYRGLGEYEQALEYLKKGLSIVRSFQNEDTLDSAHSLNQMASTLYKLERFQEALPLAKEGLQIREKIHQEPHPEIGASLGMIANILNSLKRFDEAIISRKKSIEVLKKVFGEEHQYIAISYSSLAGIYFDKGDIEDSGKFYNQSLVLSRKLLPEGNHNISTPISGLGKVAMLRKDYQKAKEYFEEAYLICSTGLPSGHIKIAKNAEYLADVLVELGDKEQATEKYRAAKTIYVELFGAQGHKVKKLEAKLSILTSG